MKKNIYWVIVVCCILILLCIGIKLGVNGGGDWGDLLSGTFGVGATIVMIMTLKEQFKINHEQRIANIISKYENLMTLFKENKEDLDELWYHGNSEITTGIKTILNNNLRNDTFSKLFNLSDDQLLKRLSISLNLLLLQIEEINFVQSANDIWNSIPDWCKQYAGFYIAWNKTFFESRNNDIRIMENRLIKSFRERTDNITITNIKIPRMPDYIPWIELNSEEEKIVSLKKERLEESKVFIKSRSRENIFIEKTMICFSENDTYEFNKEHILHSHSEKEFFIKELFDIGNFFDRITKSQEKSIQPIIKLHMKYKDNLWVYECILEFNIYDDQKASIIFKQIEGYE